jgi:hypothetical protein
LSIRDAEAKAVTIASGLHTTGGGDGVGVQRDGALVVTAARNEPVQSVATRLRLDVAMRPAEIVPLVLGRLTVAQLLQVVVNLSLIRAARRRLVQEPVAVDPSSLRRCRQAGGLVDGKPEIATRALAILIERPRREVEALRAELVRLPVHEPVGVLEHALAHHVAGHARSAAARGEPAATWLQGLPLRRDLVGLAKPSTFRSLGRWCASSASALSRVQMP